MISNIGYTIDGLKLNTKKKVLVNVIRLNITNTSFNTKKIKNKNKYPQGRVDPNLVCSKNRVIRNLANSTHT